MNNKPLLPIGTYDDNPFPNPNPNTFHGEWTNWPELHDQKSLKKDAVYTLQHNSPVPEGGKPFFVEQAHPVDGGSSRVTDDPAKARKFKGTYLLRTMWEWELSFNAVKA